MSESVTNQPGTPPVDPMAAPPAPNEPKQGRGVHLTERAAKEILRVIGEQNFPATTWVRIGAKGGGCSGFTYVLDFDQNGPSEFDLGFTQHGVNFVLQ